MFVKSHMPFDKNDEKHLRKLRKQVRFQKPSFPPAKQRTHFVISFHRLISPAEDGIALIPVSGMGERQYLEWRPDTPRWRGGI